MTTTTPGIDADALIAAAAERTGLDDFGPDTYRVGLDHLIEAIRTECKLSELGTAITPDNLIGYLENRLAIFDWHARHLETASVDLGTVVFMIGMGRTGTTILQDLLAQDPTTRVPLTWEVERPVPPPEAATYTTDPRIAEVAARVELAHQARPEMQAMHPTGATLAQECVRITGGDFHSVIFGSQYRVPSYLRWVTKDADMAPTYEYHRRFLQVIGSRYQGDRWVLKSGAHLWALPALIGEYPDARFMKAFLDDHGPEKHGKHLYSFADTGLDEGEIRERARRYTDYFDVPVERIRR